MKIFFKLFITLAILSSCAPKIKNFDKFEKSALNESNFIPTKEELEQSLPKIIIFDFDDKNIDVAKNSNLGSSIAKDIEAIITENNLAELVDRSTADKLQNEIALAQVNGDLSYSGPSVSDFAITGDISNANFSSKYVASRASYNRKTGQYFFSPAKYVYTASVSGIIKVIEIPSLKTIKTIEFNSSKSIEENVQANGGIRIGNIGIGDTSVAAQTRNDGLVREAANKAVRFVEEDIKNILAKKGYILEKRKFKNKTIFKINLGSKDGIKIGDNFHVIAKYQDQNPITNEIEEESKIIAKGKISDQINENSSWVIIEDENIDKIRMGDKIQIFYKKSFYKKNHKTFGFIGSMFDILLKLSEIAAQTK